MSKCCYPRKIEVHVPWWNFAPGVWTALERLGYELVPARLGVEAPDAHIVAANRLSRPSTEATVPIILIGEPESQGEDDPRLIGVVRSRPELPDLYELLQIALEEHPRADPRQPLFPVDDNYSCRCGEVPKDGAFGALLPEVTFTSGSCSSVPAALGRRATRFSCPASGLRQSGSS